MKALLSLALVLMSAQAFAGAKEFQALCERSDLPRATRITIDSMKKYAGEPFTHQTMSCAEAGEKLNAMTEISMPGMTFFYYFVEDISPFALLDNLRELGISNQDKIYDLSPLAGTKIETLHLIGTGVRNNLEQLEALPNLKNVSLTVSPETPIWELSRLNLRSLHLNTTVPDGSQNKDINLQPLRELNQLETLSIVNHSTRIHGLGQLMSVRSLTTSMMELDGRTLARMQLSKLEVERGTLHNPQALKDMPFITVLSLNELDIQDISFVRNLTKLTDLSLPKNKIRDASPIAGLLELRILDLSNNQIQFLDSLRNLFRLRTLNLAANQLSYTLDLSTLVSLEKVDVSYNHLMELQTRDAILPKLKEINMNGNSVRAVDFLKASALPAIESLSLDSNRIFKIDAVGGLTTLKKLEIDDNRIQDIGPLMTLKNIERLSARSNLLDNPVCPVAKADACDFLHQGI